MSVIETRRSCESFAIYFDGLRSEIPHVDHETLNSYQKNLFCSPPGVFIIKQHLTVVIADFFLH